MGYNDPWSIWPISDPWLTWPMTDDLRIKIIAYPLHTYCTNGRHVDDVAMRNWKLKRRLTHVNATKLITVKSHVFYRSNAERYWNGSWNLIDLMGQWFTRIHEPCNPSIFVDPFDPWHTDPLSSLPPSTLWLFMCIPNTPTTNPRWRTLAILKIKKLP